MADPSNSQRQTHHQNPCLQSFFSSLDPISLILSQNSTPNNPIPLRLTTESYIMERGPRYRAYAELREKKLRMKNKTQQEGEELETNSKQTSTKKQVKFSSSLAWNSRKGSSVLAQSVPDFSAALRKEIKKPDFSRSNSRGNKSVNGGDKKGGSFMVGRKSYVNVEELKGLSLAVANAINGENRGGKSKCGGMEFGFSSKTVLGYRQF